MSSDGNDGNRLKPNQAARQVSVLTGLMEKIDISKAKLLPRGTYKLGGEIPADGLVYSDLKERLQVLKKSSEMTIKGRDFRGQPDTSISQKDIVEA